MANLPITQLPVATSLTGNEQTVVVQNGVTKQASISQIANAASPGKLITSVGFTYNYYIVFYYSDGSQSQVGPVPGYVNAYVDINGDLILVDTNGNLTNVGNVIGPQGPVGPTGAAATIAVGTTTTLPPGSSATVTNSGSSSAAVFNFGIPEGQQGATGAGVAAGGTTGQVLAKLSNANYDTTWISLTGLSYQGTWNASTNTPTLTSSVGTQGYYYVVNVAGTTNLNGITDWQIGDWAVFNGSVWQKIDNTDSVTSVNGQTGTVVLTTSNIGEGTNLYYTDARARQAISAGSGISYDNSTGVITNAAPDQVVSLTNGTAISISGSYPNFTITNTAPDQIVALTAGTAISISGSYPNFTITNTAPDQIVSLTGTGTTSITGTYPNFTINSADQYTGTVTSINLTAGTGISVSGGPITTSGSITVTNTAPDQIVSLTGAGTTTISGTYPNFTITSNDQYVGDVVGPASATDNAIARFDTTTGKLIQNSVVTIDDTGNISGVNSIVTPDFITFDTTAAATSATAKLFWDDGDGVLATGLKGGNVTLQIGTQEYARVFNDSGTTLTKGQAVYISGAQGNRVAVKLARADLESTSFGTIGLVAETIANGAEGFIIVSGALYKLNTLGLTAGATVYLSPTVAGGITTTKPQAPDQLVVLGWVERVDNNVGSIYVKIDNGYEIDELHDVRITSPQSGNVLIYDASTSPIGVWKNANLTDGTGISITEGPGSVTITNSGVTQATAGTGISVSAGTGNVTITNTAPDQIVSLTGAGTTSITGTYPNFTITSNDQYVGTVTSVSGTGTVNGITLSGTVTSSGSLTLGGTLDLSAPPAIGGVTPNAITGTTITATNYVGISGGTF